MSLSLDLLEKKIDKVRQRIKRGANLNDFDSYGYTPLIIAIMTEQEDAVSLLMAHGASCNKPDLFGQPPLHWAVKTESETLCERLFQKGAFPNTISAYGEPLLVYPLLKRNHKLIDVLVQHGTDKTCAEDYILIKSLGHHFELEGYGLFKNYNLLISLVDYQGFRLEFSVGHLARQVETAVLAGKLPTQATHEIREILGRAQKLRQLKKALPSEQEANFVHYLSDINFLPMAFDGHAVSLAHSTHFVACCDRSKDRTETTVLYRMPTALSTDQIGFFLYAKKTRAFWNDLPRMLQWKKICALDIPFQIVGNCSWANLEPAPILLDALIMLEQGLPPQPQEWSIQVMQWAQWNKNNLMQQALIRTAQLKGDRRTALLLTLFQIFITSPSQLEKFEPLMDLLRKEYKMFQAIAHQHQIANTVWWPKMAQWLKKNT